MKITPFLAIFLVLALPGCRGKAPRLNTWTIVAADPATGDVGVTGASCVPMPIDAIAALVPGRGAAATQAFFDLDNRNKVYELLRAGESAAQIVKTVSDGSFDSGANDRQYGVVTLRGGKAETAGFTGKNAIAWAGSQQDDSRAVAVQGNILAGPAVVTDAMDAFSTDVPDGRNELADRLMRALEAGSAAGGDVRCNNARVRQTAAAAFILVARGGDAPYAARNIGITDKAKPTAPWLALSVSEREFGPNPVTALRKDYDAWRAAIHLR
jgi:uncharacterized Ntn-hydrolase superfamily protein